MRLVRFWSTSIPSVSKGRDIVQCSAIGYVHVTRLFCLPFNAWRFLAVRLDIFSIAFKLSYNQQALQPALFLWIYSFALLHNRVQISERHPLLKPASSLTVGQFSKSEYWISQGFRLIPAIFNRADECRRLRNSSASRRRCWRQCFGLRSWWTVLSDNPCEAVYREGASLTTLYAPMLRRKGN